MNNSNEAVRHSCEGVSILLVGDVNANSNDATQMSSLESDPEKNNVRENVAPDDLSADPKYGIHWQSPTAMIGTYLFGVCLAVALHCYYASLSGETVGNNQEQQRALRSAYPLAILALSKVQMDSNSRRSGTTLAFLTQVCLVLSVSLAFTQCLWRVFRHNDMSIADIDAAAAANSSLLSFFNLGMLSKMKIGSLLALTAW